MAYLLWNSEMKKPIKVTKYASSLDVLPTILNLFGIEYDSRLLMGTDILSNSEPLVIFSNRSFITDKGRYNSIKKKFIGEEVPVDYVETINLKIYNKYKYSRLVLEKDYYRKLYERLGWIQQ
jgi:phosphoglycerol transferase MdoB-like AlkP superfamily enzyme